MGMEFCSCSCWDRAKKSKVRGGMYLKKKPGHMGERFFAAIRNTLKAVHQSGQVFHKLLGLLLP